MTVVIFIELNELRGRMVVFVNLVILLEKLEESITFFLDFINFTQFLVLFMLLLSFIMIFLHLM